MVGRIGCWPKGPAFYSCYLQTFFSRASAILKLDSSAQRKTSKQLAKLEDLVLANSMDNEYSNTGSRFVGSKKVTLQNRRKQFFPAKIFPTISVLSIFQRKSNFHKSKIFSRLSQR